MEENMNLKILGHLLLIFVVISCNKKESKTSTPSLVITGSGSANAYKSLYQMTSAGKVLVGSPTSLILKLYAIYISQNEDCTNPEKVADFGAAGKIFNLLDSPTLFAREVTHGTYQCLILKMSDHISYRVDQEAVDGGVPQEATRACESVTKLHSGDLYRTKEVGQPDEEWYDIETGTTIIGKNEEQVVYIFASTLLVPPAPIHEHQYLPLGNPLVVPGAAVFYADFNDGVENTVGGCGLEHGGFGFR